MSNSKYTKMVEAHLGDLLLSMPKEQFIKRSKIDADLYSPLKDYLLGHRSRRPTNARAIEDARDHVLDSLELDEAAERAKKGQA